eukprot:7660716-Alexandrium_andersonii.AAC.1
MCIRDSTTAKELRRQRDANPQLDKLWTEKRAQFVVAKLCQKGSSRRFKHEKVDMKLFTEQSDSKYRDFANEFGVYSLEECCKKFAKKK